MKEVIIASIIGLGVALLLGVLLVFGTLNSEASSRNQTLAQVSVVELRFDTMWKIIQQRTQVTKASADFQKELVKSLVEGRAASFIKIVNESNPPSAFTTEQFTSLGNALEGQRETFFREQKKMVDLGRENHLLFDSVPSGIILSVFGRQKVVLPELITSTATKEAVKSGKEDNVKLEL
jgi:hypothetical protein